MVCQTMPDLFFLTENQPLDVYLNQNCILPLSALLEEHPGLKALFSEQQWASKTYYRRIYAVPARAVSMYQIGFLAGPTGYGSWVPGRRRSRIWMLCTTC